MSLHNYFFDGQKSLMFEWGSLRETDYQSGDKLSWNYFHRPSICDGIVSIPAYDDTVSDIESGYYLITLENDVFINAIPISRQEYDEQVRVIEAIRNEERPSK